MQTKSAYKLLNDLPLHTKLLLFPAVPLVFIILIGVMTYFGLLTFFDDEERLNASYVLQKTAAEYMRSVADLEASFLKVHHLKGRGIFGKF